MVITSEGKKQIAGIVIKKVADSGMSQKDFALCIGIAPQMLTFIKDLDMHENSITMVTWSILAKLANDELAIKPINLRNRKRFEYTECFYDCDRYLKKMNEMGQNGWELVFANKNQEGMYCIFKRGIK